jgi:hypothetical protein
MMRKIERLTVAALLAAPAGLRAHSFGQSYSLPVPIWLYLYGAAASLIASFVVVGFFVNVKSADANERTVLLDGYTLFRQLHRPSVLASLRAFSVFSLLLCIMTGLFGKDSAYQNFNMTFFWVIFVLGFTYLTALIGNLYALINPWLVITEWIEKIKPAAFKKRFTYPENLAYYPALTLYMIFIWIELFGGSTPFSLALILLAYTLINLAGAWCVGTKTWFQYAEFFAVFFRLIGLMSVIGYRKDAQGSKSLYLRQPFIGLLRKRPEHLSLVIFVMFMLSSTAFDGIKHTVMWISLFWKHLYQLLAPLTGSSMLEHYAFFQKLYAFYQAAGLMLSPFIYLAIFFLFVSLAKWVTRSKISLRLLVMQFSFSLIPIVFVYNITHYYTLILTQGIKIFPLASDPFGLGWNIFDTKHWFAKPQFLDPVVIWHTQVWLILAGHIASVYLAHLVALKVFPTQRLALISQIPMLLLMLCFTTVGLWILSLPLQAGMPALG